MLFLCPTYLVPSEAGGKTPEVGFRQEVVEGRERQLPGCGGQDALTGGVGAGGIGQAELRGLFRGPKHLKMGNVWIRQGLGWWYPPSVPPAPGVAVPSSCHTLVGTWARLQEELLHWRLTPMQKHLRQPSGFCLLRWNEPSEHSLHKRPTTLFCGRRVGSCRLAHRKGCLEPAVESIPSLDGGVPGSHGKRSHIRETSRLLEQSPPDCGAY